MRALKARSDVIQAIVRADPALPAAVTDVAAYRVPQAFRVLIQHRQRACLTVDEIEIDVLVEADILSFCRGENESFADRIEAFGIESFIFSDEANVAGFTVHNVQLRGCEISPRGIAVTEEINVIVDHFDRIDREKRIGHTSDLFCVG